MLLQQASLDIQDPQLKALIDSLPEAPAAARQRCLKMCGMVTEEDDSMSYSYSYSYDYDYASSKNGKRNLRA